MRGVRLYETINGKEWEEAIAYIPGVQKPLALQAKKVKARAEKYLAGVESRVQAEIAAGTYSWDDGANRTIPRIRIAKGDLDYWVFLDHPWAVSIEFGHDGYLQIRESKNGPYMIAVGASKGLNIMGRTFESYG